MTLSKILIIFLSLQLTFPPHLLAQMPPLPDNGYKQQIAGIEKMVSFTQKFRAHINREAFEFDPLLDALEYESGSIINFVKTSVVFEQYPGVLRGPNGTLQGLSGNALDQSILLAKLLRDAGYEARIVKANLSPDQAQQVLRQMLGPVQTLPPMGDANGMLNALEEFKIVGPDPFTDEQKESFLVHATTQPGPQASPLYEAVLKNRDGINEGLKSAGLSFDHAASSDKLLQEAREYFWVQFKDAAAQPWADAHPVFPGELPIDSLTPSEFFSDSIPEQYQHRLRFQVLIERKVNNKLVTQPLTEPWERPVANMVGIPITFGNVPNSLLGPDAPSLDLEQALEKATSFVPAMGSSIAPGASFFDMNGTLIDPMAAANSAAGVFEQVGRGFRDGISEIGGNNALPVLTAQILVFTLISPSGQEQEFSRTTFDRIGPAARATGELPDLPQATSTDIRSIMQRYSFMVTGGRTHRAFAMDFAAKRFIDSQPTMDAAARIANGLPPQNGKGGSGNSSVSGDWVGFPTLFTEFDRAELLSADHRIFRAGPGLGHIPRRPGERIRWPGVG